MGLEKFTLAHSKVPRYTRSTNNYAEHINSSLLNARDLPILHGLYEIYMIISTKHFARQQKEYPIQHFAIQFWRDKVFGRTEISRTHTIRQNGKLFLKFLIQ